MEFAKWRAALANVLIMNNLTQVVEDAKAPTEQAVAGLFSSESQEQIKERFTAALRDYQQENTQLFFLIAPSLNLNGPWEQNDIETIQRDYCEGLLRDGNGILRWFISMHDIQQPSKQMALRASLQKTKFTIEGPPRAIRQQSGTIGARARYCKFGWVRVLFLRCLGRGQ